MNGMWSVYARSIVSANLLYSWRASVEFTRTAWVRAGGGQMFAGWWF